MFFSLVERSEHRHCKNDNIEGNGFCLIRDVLEGLMSSTLTTVYESNK